MVVVRLAYYLHDARYNEVLLVTEEDKLWIFQMSVTPGSTWQVIGHRNFL